MNRAAKMEKSKVKVSMEYSIWKPYLMGDPHFFASLCIVNGELFFTRMYGVWSLQFLGVDSTVGFDGNTFEPQNKFCFVLVNNNFCELNDFELSLRDPWEGWTTKSMNTVEWEQKCFDSLLNTTSNFYCKQFSYDCN